jgi:hypothetical protein
MASKEDTENGTKQREIPGVVEQISALPDVTRAAKKLRELRSEWQELGGRVEKAKDALIDRMHTHSIKSYIAAGLRIELVEGKETVRVKEIGEEVAEAAGE